MKTIKVVGAIIKKNDKVLIAQRKKGEFAGLWEFPGGKIEFGETAENALKREIQEELEVQIHINDYLITAEYDYASFHLSMDCYICELIDNTFSLNDHTAIQWIPLDIDISTIKWVPADVQVIKALQSHSKKLDHMV